MSVIPFIIEGPNRTVVEKEQEFQDAGGREGRAVLIRNFDRDQFRSSKDTNVSYDLRVGCEYRDHRDLSKRDLGENDTIQLLPGAAVIIETEESVHFPKSYFGHIVPRVSLLQKGISNTSSKVDPGYNDNLLVTVFNLGKKTVQLRRHERFCALYVLQVREDVRPYDKEGKRITIPARRQRWQRLRDLLEANSGLLLAILVTVTIILIIFNVIQLIRD